jgi:uncharacterized protein YutE (UPF0331/DUF86 family)
LAELGVLEEARTVRLVRMAKVRNLLMHLYGKVDGREVYRLVRDDLGDFERYLPCVGTYLGSELA